MRAQVTRILEGSDLWDGRRNFVYVADTPGATLQLQIDVSAANTDNLFALQSIVREKVAAFLFEHYPESLARNRTQALSVAAPPPTATND